jgi:1-deoxyxylulose-5-phosphate synthase
MDYTRFGKTGMKVSKLCLGCMTYGSSQWRDWVLEEEASRPFIKTALEKGVNFFDTADILFGRGERRDSGQGVEGFRQAP